MTLCGLKGADLISEPIPNGMIWICVDNEDLILDYALGKIRHSFMPILSRD